MRRASSLVLAGLGAVALTGAATAASRDVHTLDVPRPDGSIAKIEYVGKVAPKVSVTPAPLAAPFAPFDLFGRSAFDFQRHMDAMMRQIDEASLSCSRNCRCACRHRPDWHGYSTCQRSRRLPR